MEVEEDCDSWCLIEFMVLRCFTGLDSWPDPALLSSVVVFERRIDSGCSDVAAACVST